MAGWTKQSKGGHQLPQYIPFPQTEAPPPMGRGIRVPRSNLPPRWTRRVDLLESWLHPFSPHVTPPNKGPPWTPGGTRFWPLKVEFYRGTGRQLPPLFFGFRGWTSIPAWTKKGTGSVMGGVYIHIHLHIDIQILKLYIALYFDQHFNVFRGVLYNFRVGLYIWP